MQVGLTGTIGRRGAAVVLFETRPQSRFYGGPVPETRQNRLRVAGFGGRYRQVKVHRRALPKFG